MPPGSEQLERDHLGHHCTPQRCALQLQEARDAGGRGATRRAFLEEAGLEPALRSPTGWSTPDLGKGIDNIMSKKGKESLERGRVPEDRQAENKAQSPGVVWWLPL